MNQSKNPMSAVEFYPLKADGENYPESVLTAFPHVSCREWQSFGKGVAPSAFLDVGESYAQGRYALAEALRRAGAAQHKAVLIPAFHCRVMVEPLLYLGGTPCFYPLTAGLQPDFAVLSELLTQSPVPVVAMLLPHYFGFPNALDEAEKFCLEHGIALIEDCAHAFYGRSGGRLLGSVGSYAIASPWKFLPIRDGGVLRDNTGGKAVRHVAPSWLAEAKALAAMLQTGVERVWQRGALPEINAEALCAQARMIAARDGGHMPEPGLKEFLPERAAMSALRSSIWGTRHASHGRVAHCRRENYSQWLAGVRELKGVQALFPDLPDGVVPYAFPLLIDVAGLGFHLLKLAGIPLWRWEDMAVTDCAIARDYRIRLLQLPCHQGLSAEQLAWMIRIVQLAATRLESGQEWTA